MDDTSVPPPSADHPPAPDPPAAPPKPRRRAAIPNLAPSVSVVATGALVAVAVWLGLTGGERGLLAALAIAGLLAIWWGPTLFLRSYAFPSTVDPEAPPHEQAKQRAEDDARRAKAEDDARKTVVQLVGGAALIAGLFFTQRSFQATQRSLDSARDTLALQQTGQITDRYTKAVAQLGDGQIEVRLGGIYALERLAKDSPADEPTITAVLAAFVTTRSQRDALPAPPVADEQAAPCPQTDRPITRDQVRDVPVDIEAALAVLERRGPPREERLRPIFGQVNLRGRRLYITQPAGSFDGADFSHAQIWRLNLAGSALGDANFAHSWLYAPDFSGAWMASSRFFASDLLGARFTNANLFGADFRCAGFSHGVDFTGAVLLYADLTDSVGLEEADLRKAQRWEYAKLPAHLKHLEYGAEGQPARKPQ